MITCYAHELGRADPLDGLAVGERPEPVAVPGEVIVEVRAASLNRHDLWTLQGITLVPVTPPVTLGCDGAGVDSLGNDVVIYPVLGHGADFRMLTDGVDGTLAPLVRLPAVNVVSKPPNLSFEEAACLGTTWLTAWSALRTRAGLRPGERVLVQGATGGLSNAAITLARAMGAEVIATSTSNRGLDLARRLGAHQAIRAGEEIVTPVDVVIDSVGQATWLGSLRALDHGGRLVTLGATTGIDAQAGIRQLFRKDLTVHGHKMGTLSDFHELCDFVRLHDLHPYVGEVVKGVDAAPALLRRLAEGSLAGKGVVAIG